MKVFVTGIGVISAVGLDARENLHSLKSLRTGIHKSAQYKVMTGEVPLNNEQLLQIHDLPDEDYSRTTLLALPAAKEAWGNNKNDSRIRTGLISSTSVGGMDRTEKYSLMIHDNGRTTEKLAEELGISGHISTISTACSSGANSIMQGARLIEGNILDRVIAGGSEPLATFDIKGFNSLNIYDKDICKPFDEKRMGLNLGEGAAFVVLENEQSISITGNKPLCILCGW